MKPACQHIGLFVENIDEMTKFYTEKLGFEFKYDFRCEPEMMKPIFDIDAGAEIRYLDLRGMGMELFKFDIPLDKRKDHTSGLNHWTILVEDKYQFCEKLEADGVPVIKIEKPHGHTFFIKDPEQNLIEVKSFEI